MRQTKIPTKKNLKPIDIDLHFKYRCSNSKCGYEHWLSLQETKTSNFKIVCDCGLVLKPKKIKNIKVCYEKIEQTPISESPTLTESSVDASNKIPVDLQEKSVKLLIKHGFTLDESLQLTQRAYSKNPVNTPSQFIRYIISNLGELDEHN